MIKPNMVNPQNFSVEALDRVGDFYKQSFEQLSQFYAESFSQLLWTVGGVGFIAGLAAPAVVWFFNNKILKKDRNEMEQSIKKTREELEGAINKIKNEYEKKLEESLKKFKEDFEKEARDLGKKIYSSQVFSLISVSMSERVPEVSCVFLEEALSFCLKEELKASDFFSVIGRIKNLLSKVSEIEYFKDSNLENYITELQKYKKDDALFQNMVSELQIEYYKALARLEEKNKQT